MGTWIELMSGLVSAVQGGSGLSRGLTTLRCLVVESDPPIDDSPIGMLVVCLFMVCVVLAMVGVGMAIGLAAAAMGGALLTAGVVSTSAIVAVVRRSPTAGLRTLVMLSAVLSGIPAGTFGGFLAKQITGSELSWIVWMIFGSVVGAGLGIGVGLMTQFLGRKAWGWIWKRAKRNTTHDAVIHN